MKQIINIPDGYTHKGVKTETSVTVDFIKVDKEKEPKEFFKQFLTGLELVTDKNYPDSVFYKKNSKVIFELQQYPKNKYFLVDYNIIREVLGIKSWVNYAEMQSFIKNQVESTLKLEEVTIAYSLARETLAWSQL